jgi:hypothetical protein
VAEEQNPDVVEARRRLVEEGFIDPDTGFAKRPPGAAKPPVESPAPPSTPSSVFTSDPRPARRAGRIQPDETEVDVLRRMERLLRSTSQSVETIKSIMVFFTVLWGIGVVLWIVLIVVAAGQRN